MDTKIRVLKNPVSYRIVSYRIVSYRIVSYRIVSYRIVSPYPESPVSVSYRPYLRVLISSDTKNNTARHRPRRGPGFVIPSKTRMGRLRVAVRRAFIVLADPTTSGAVEFVLSQILKPAEPPRSWPKAEKLLFATLPPAIQAAIARREIERDAGLRKKQTELDIEIKKLTQPEKNQTNGNESKG